MERETERMERENGARDGEIARMERETERVGCRVRHENEEMNGPRDGAGSLTDCRALPRRRSLHRVIAALGFAVRPMFNAFFLVLIIVSICPSSPLRRPRHRFRDAKP
jgi:hypothetical protein